MHGWFLQPGAWTGLLGRGGKRPDPASAAPACSSGGWRAAALTQRREQDQEGRELWEPRRKVFLEGSPGQLLNDAEKPSPTRVQVIPGHRYARAVELVSGLPPWAGRSEGQPGQAGVPQGGEEAQVGQGWRGSGVERGQWFKKGSEEHVGTFPAVCSTTC